MEQYFKAIVPAPVAAHADVTVHMGSHGVVRGGSLIDGAVSPEGLFLAHHPIRSVRQAAGKAFAGWLTMLSTPNIGPRSGYQWGKLYERFATQGLAGHDVTELAMTYLAREAEDPSARTPPIPLVRDPIRHDLSNFDLRFPTEYQIDPLMLLATTAEDIAREVGRQTEAASG